VTCAVHANIGLVELCAALFGSSERPNGHADVSNFIKHISKFSMTCIRMGYTRQVSEPFQIADEHPTYNLMWYSTNHVLRLDLDWAVQEVSDVSPVMLP
jgi:hypothetical protein